MRRLDTPRPDELRELEALDRALAGEPVDADLRHLEELVLDIRATAPQMSPGFAARLEHEVSEGFPSPSGGPARPRRRRRWALMPAAGVLAAALIAIVVVLPGGSDVTPNDISAGPEVTAREQAEPAIADSGAGTDSAGGAAESAPLERKSTAPPQAAAPPAQPGVAADESASAPQRRSSSPVPGSGGAGSGASTGSVTPSRAPRKVERTALIVLEADDGKVESTADAVIRTVDRFSGIVASSAIGADESSGEATFDLRIPTERLDAAIAALSKLGHVVERSQNLQDITGSFTSAQDRLADARAERRGLLKALGNATTEQRIDSLRSRLRLVRSRIARITGELNALRRRADLSTVSVTVRGKAGGSDGDGSGGGAWTPGDAAGDALRVLEVMAGVALIALAIGLPLLLLAGLVAYGTRIGRRRRREGALDAA